MLENHISINAEVVFSRMSSKWNPVSIHMKGYEGFLCVGNTQWQFNVVGDTLSLRRSPLFMCHPTTGGSVAAL